MVENEKDIGTFIKLVSLTCVLEFVVHFCCSISYRRRVLLAFFDFFINPTFLATSLYYTHLPFSSLCSEATNKTKHTFLFVENR